MRKNILLIALSMTCFTASAQTFQLNSDGYFNASGTDVMAFNDFYPEGHQGGVCVIMNGHRIATNGDIRLEATPGQWQPVPKQLSRRIEGGKIVTTLCYPDSSRHLTGFNPMVYPEWHVNYTVTVEPQGKSILVTVDLDKPVPDFLLGKAGFNLEFFPGELFGKPWMMDAQSGIYPQQPNTPLLQLSTNRGHDGNYFAGRGQQADLALLDGTGYSPLRADDIIAAPYAIGRKFTSRPDDRSQRLTVESMTGDLKLYDGRMNHNNGWFVLRSEIASGATKGAVRWLITPAIDETWRYPAVIQTSQVGYLPQQPKRIVIETDKRETTVGDVQLVRIGADGETVVRTSTPKVWGQFLRYRYLTADFGDVTEPGLYQVRYGNSQSSVFRIAGDVYERGVWQPVVEYFLPVQMCHVRVAEKYRIWHDACHLDDALMARVGNHIDGYDQRPGLSKHKEGEQVPGVNIGGWHDAGDFDLRVESQAGEAEYLDFILARQDGIVKNIARTGWFTARIAKQLEAKSLAKGIGSRDRKTYRAFVTAFRTALANYKAQLDRQAAETPYGVPYRPSIWGAGWDIQRFGFEYYFLTNAYPDIFPKETVYNALNFVLGCHPGSNTASFASGVGARSATVAYGLNRADWSYIPGGVVSGTALIRPDFPELLEFPFLWQQTEYVLGGGSSHYMFLVLAATAIGRLAKDLDQAAKM